MSNQNRQFAELGENLANLAGAMVTNPIAMIAAARRFTDAVFGISPPRCGGAVRVEHTCCGIIRHHYSCCCVPLCTGCGGPCR
jgi:hypothetical protein